MSTAVVILGSVALVACLTGAGCAVWALRSRASLAGLRRENADLAARDVEARESARTRAKAIAGVTHELRTPLTAVIGFSELLRDGRAGPVTARQQEQLGIVRSSAGHLLSLIDEMLDSARVEAGHVRLDPVPTAPDDVAAECVVPLRHLAAERGVMLDYRRVPLGAALLDPGRLRQVLTNFLSNAIKFTDPGGRVTLSVVRREARLVVSVRDTGIGIAERDRARVFDEFVRLGGAERPGSGLGLALTREIVHAQGGGVGVESTPGAGSTFTAWLPWVDAQGAPAHSESAWQAVVAAMGFDADERGTRPTPTLPEAPRTAGAGRLRRRRRVRTTGREPRPADGASTPASAPAGRP